MLVLTRKLGESLRIYLGPVDPELRAVELFRPGPIEIMVVRFSGNQVKIGVGARPEFVVLRSELDRRGPEGSSA